jgi:hypothetical protein
VYLQNAAIYFAERHYFILYFRFAHAQANCAIVRPGAPNGMMKNSARLDLGGLLRTTLLLLLREEISPSNPAEEAWLGTGNCDPAKEQGVLKTESTSHCPITTGTIEAM